MFPTEDKNELLGMYGYANVCSYVNIYNPSLPNLLVHLLPFPFISILPLI